MFPGSLAKQFLTKHFVNNYYLIKCHLRYNEMKTQYSKSNIQFLFRKTLTYTSNELFYYSSTADQAALNEGHEKQAPQQVFP